LRGVIFDSSFMMAVAESPTPWLEDISLLVGGFDPLMLECVRKELLKIASQKGKRSKVATLALRLSREFRIVPCGPGPVDDEIASAAVAGGSLVATVDRELIHTLKALKVGIIRLRSGRVSRA
jgi:rRNA-processing protein FCF1